MNPRPPKRRRQEKPNQAVGSLDAFYAQWHRLRTLAAMLKSCEELRGCVTVEAELIGDLGNLLEEELRQMRGTLRSLEKRIPRMAEAKGIMGQKTDYE